MSNAKLYYLNGKYFTLKELSSLYDIKLNTLRIRLQKGIPIEDAVKIPLNIMRGKRKFVFKLNGKEVNLTEIAQKLNIHPTTIYHRIQNGMSVEQSITTPKTIQIGKFSYKGKPISRREIAKMVGISLKSVKRRLKSGESVESIIETGRKDKIYMYKGKRYSFPELAKLPECVISISTFRKRLDNGWSVEKAITTPAMRNGRK